MATGSTGEKRSRKATRQAEILKAAVIVIAEKGYHNTRMSDIATEAGVAYGLVYHYFGSKENILGAIFQSTGERFIERIERISAEQKPMVDKLTEVCDYMLDTYIARPDLIRLLVQQVVRSSYFENLPDLDIVKDILVKINEIFQDGVGKGEIQADADTELLSFAFFGSIEMLLTALTGGLYQRGKQLQQKDIKQIKVQMRKFIHSGSFG